jgi:hypothetical protein
MPRRCQLSYRCGYTFCRNTDGDCPVGTNHELCHRVAEWTEGAEIAQLYLSFPLGVAPDEPPRQLKGFAKIQLAPTEASVACLCSFSFSSSLGFHYRGTFSALNWFSHSRMLFGILNVAGQPPGYICDVISVVPEFMADVAGVAAWLYL